MSTMPLIWGVSFRLPCVLMRLPLSRLDLTLINRLAVGLIQECTMQNLPFLIRRPYLIFKFEASGFKSHKVQMSRNEDQKKYGSAYHDPQINIPTALDNSLTNRQQPPPER